jgi:hypothetical protein
MAAALREANADQPVGPAGRPGAGATLRVEGRVRDPRAFASVVVARRNGLPLTLSDLGELSEREREPDSWPASTASSDQLQRLQAAGRQHRQDRRRRQEGHRGAAQEPAQRRRTA